MGGAAGKIVGTIGSALIGKALGPKQKNPYDAAAAAAASAPSQTPEQKEASKTLLPVLQGWMQNTPQLPFRAYTPTQFTGGFGGTNTTQRPQVQGTPTFGGSVAGPTPTFGGAVAGNAGQGGATYQATAAPVAQPASSGWGYTPGSWTEDRSAINAAQSALDTARAEYDRLQQRLASMPATITSQQPAQNAIYPWQRPSSFEDVRRAYAAQGAQVADLGNGRALVTYNGMGGTDRWGRPYSQMGPQVIQYGPAQSANPEYQALQSQLEAANQRLTAAQEAYDKAIQAGPAKSYNAGSMHIADMPTINPLFGSVGAYQPGQDYSGLVAQTMGAPAPSGFGYQSAMTPAAMGMLRRMSAPIHTPGGGYSPLDWSGLAQRVGSMGPDGGYREDTKIGAPLQTDKFLPYTNDLEQISEGRIRQNMDRSLQEGFGADYLKDLAAQGLDPLKEAYNMAMDRATGDFNRMGLRGSGFELLGKYGNSPDSITGKFLQEAGSVARDVGLRGAEAAREDRFRNAALQDQALGMGLSLSGRQGADQFQRLSGDLGREVTERNLMSQADQRNEASRQFWAQFGRAGESAAADIAMRQDQANEAARQGWWGMLQNAALANRGLAKAGFEGLTGLQAQDRASQQYWNEDDLKRQQLANQNILTGVDALSRLAQQDEANRQWWANTLENQQRYDDANRWHTWQQGLELMKYLAARDDEAQRLNLATQLGLDRANLIDIPQQGISNLINFINSQGSAANNAQQNYWNAFNAANQANQQALAQQAAIGQMFSGLFTPTTRPPVAPVNLSLIHI